MKNSPTLQSPTDLTYQNINTACALSDRIPILVRSILREVCKELPAKYEFEGNHYCILHLPCSDKWEEFETEIDERIRKGNHFFSGVHFPSNSSFAYKKFKHEVSFDHATFAGRMDFSGTTFEKDVRLRGAIFEANSEVIFYLTRFFADLRLNGALIKGHIRFEGGVFYDSEGGGLEEKIYWLFEREFSSIDFQQVTIENPEWISFHIARLQPSWFVGTISKDFVFHDCYWKQWDGQELDIEEELYVMTRDMFHEIPSPAALLTSTCRQLSSNCEESSRFLRASYFRNMANEIEWDDAAKNRKAWVESLMALLSHGVHCGSLSDFSDCLVSIAQHGRKYRVDFLNRLYRFSSRHSESPKRAFGVLSGILLISVILYLAPWSRFDKVDNQSLTLFEAVPYALKVMTLQRPEPLPKSDFAKWVTSLETIFAPLQFALLALSVRRRFMR